MRLSKDVGNTHYTYLYQNGLLVQETIGDKVLDYSYTSGGQIVSVRYKTNAADNGVYYYYALNSRGDVVGLYDHTGALYAKYTYDVWGNPISVKNASGANLPSDDIANIQSLRYRGYYFDSDTGFYYLQSRYYDPVTHRFINADGMVYTGTGFLGFNMYAYCENNSINMIDELGEDPVPTWAKRINNGTATEDDYDKALSVNPNAWAGSARYTVNKALLAAEHQKKGTTNPANRQKHQEGQSRKQKDQYGGEKGDSRRKSRSNKRRKETLPDYGLAEKVLATGIIIVSVVGVVILAADDCTGIGAVDDAAIAALVPIIWDNAAKLCS